MTLKMCVFQQPSLSHSDRTTLADYCTCFVPWFVLTKMYVYSNLCEFHCRLELLYIKKYSSSLCVADMIQYAQSQHRLEVQ